MGEKVIAPLEVRLKTRERTTEMEGEARPTLGERGSYDGGWRARSLGLPEMLLKTQRRCVWQSSGYLIKLRRGEEAADGESKAWYSKR